MANNRLYIRCKRCGETVFIGKHSLGALTVDKNVADRLNEFYDRHSYCGIGHYSLELCEEFPGEMTDNNIDNYGKVYWFNESGY